MPFLPRSVVSTMTAILVAGVLTIPFAGDTALATDATGGDQEAVGLDIASLAAHRTAQLVRRDTAITVSKAATAAAERKRIDELGYDPATATEPREIARQMMLNRYDWGEDQFTCYDAIIMRESLWDTYADNPTSSAYGIPQALPGSKMASAGADWKTNPATQISWGLGYVKQRYGTPCQAWSFKRAHGWY